MDPFEASDEDVNAKFVPRVLEFFGNRDDSNGINNSSVSNPVRRRSAFQIGIKSLSSETNNCWKMWIDLNRTTHFLWKKSICFVVMIRKKQNARALVRCTESSVSVENGEGKQQAMWVDMSFLAIKLLSITLISSLRWHQFSLLLTLGTQDYIRVPWFWRASSFWVGLRSELSRDNGRCTYQAKDTFEKPRADSKMPRMECPSSVLWRWMNWWFVYYWVLISFVAQTKAKIVEQISQP